MAVVRGKALAGWGEAFYRIEGALRQGEPASEVGVGGQGRGEPVTQLPDLVLGGEVLVVQSDACSRGGGVFLGSAPMDELGFGDREGQAFRGRNAAKGAVVTLKKLDVPSVGGRCNCDHQVINLGENQASGYGGVKGRHVDDE